MGLSDNVKTENITKVPYTNNMNVNIIVDDNDTIKQIPLSNIQNIVSVKNLGAAGDGVADDTAIIKDAFSGKYSSVYIPSGVYMVNSAIPVGDNVRIFGDGPSSVIKAKAGAGDVETTTAYPDPHRKINILAVTGKKNVLFQDFCVDGNKDGYDTNPDNLEVCSRHDHVVCMEITHCTDIWMKGITIKNALIEGVYVWQCTNVIISDCAFLDNGFLREDASGLHCDGQNTNVTITGCISARNGFHGFLLADIDGLTLSSCVADTNGYEGFLIQYEANHIILSNIVAKRNGRHGILVKNDCKYIMISGARIFYNEGNGIQLQGVRRFRLTGSIISNNSMFGIYIYDAAKVYLDGITCTKDTINDIFVYETNTPLANIFIDTGATKITGTSSYDDWGTVGTMGSITPGTAIAELSDKVTKMYDALVANGTITP